MLVNADFTRRATVAPAHYEWVPSPQPGVDRVMLDRMGGEQARATSLVRYAPGAGFPRHGHPGGEEILVLAGTWREGETDYPAGWYLRNPPGSAHAPCSPDGALIFVKLGHMAASDAVRVRIDTRDPARWLRREVFDVCPLHERGGEWTGLMRLDAGRDGPAGRAELLVLDGTVVEGDAVHERGTWLRLPARTTAGPAGATLYVKTGHLPGGEAP